jgi:hypothetical protein
MVLRACEALSAPLRPRYIQRRIRDRECGALFSSDVLIFPRAAQGRYGAAHFTGRGIENRGKVEALSLAALLASRSRELPWIARAFGSPSRKAANGHAPVGGGNRGGKVCGNLSCHLISLRIVV